MTGLPAAPARARKTWAAEASLEAAEVMRKLMRSPWLVSGRDDDDIARVRRNVDAVRDAFGRLGWVVIVERDFVRLRKTPPVRLDSYAAGAPSALTFQWFFLLVAAAETLGRKVGLAALVGATRSAAAEAKVASSGDQLERRAIVAALRMLDERGVIVEMDGTVEDFIDDEDARVLLEIHHSRLLHVIANYGPVDPASDPHRFLEALTREPDPARRMRRRLVDDTVVHACDLDEAEADWLSRRVRSDDGAPLAAAFGLHLERRAEGAAFVVPEEARRHGRDLGPIPFPASGTAAHAAYLLIEWAQSAGQADDPAPGWRTLGHDDVAGFLAAQAERIGSGAGGWEAGLVLDTAKLVDAVAGLLDGLDLARVEPVTASWSFAPVTGRWKSSRGEAGAAQPAGPARRAEPRPQPTLDFGVTE